MLLQKVTNVGSLVFFKSFATSHMVSSISSSIKLRNNWILWTSTNQPVTIIQKMKWYHMMYFSSLRSQVGMWKSLGNFISSFPWPRIFRVVVLFSAYSEVIMGQFSRSQWSKSTQWTTGSTWWFVRGIILLQVTFGCFSSKSSSQLYSVL